MVNQVSPPSREFWYRHSRGGYLTPVYDQISNGPRLYGLTPTNPPPVRAGMVTDTGRVVVSHGGTMLVDEDIETLRTAWKAPLDL